MFSTSKAVASSGFEAMTIPRSSSRIPWIHAIVSLAALAGRVVKTWSYLFLK